MKHYFCETCEEVNDQPSNAWCTFCGPPADSECKYCGAPVALMADICEDCSNDDILNDDLLDEEDEEFLRGPFNR